MKRFHVHAHVENLAASVSFYSRMFAAAADMTLRDEGNVSCCCARSAKHWIIDPQGIAWEHFHTLGDIPAFSEKPARAESTGSACCATSTAQGDAGVFPAKPASCCGGDR